MLDPSKTAFGDNATDITLPQGDHCLIRQLRSEDEALLRDMFEHCNANDVYLRCFAAMKSFPENMAARLAHMNPEEEIALVALPATGDPAIILGVAHVILESETALTAEFDVMVRSDQKGHGIGYALMTALLNEARLRGFSAVTGYILQENRAMLQMTDELGFKVRHMVGGVAEVWIDFTEDRDAA